MGYLDEYLERARIHINLKTCEAEFNFEISDVGDDEEFEWIINKGEELQELIALVVKTIEYLEVNGFVVIYSVTPDKFSEEIKFGQGVEGNLSSPFTDEKIAKLLAGYIYKEIIPLASLSELKNNKFVLPDEKRFSEKMFATWAAIIVSLFIGLSGIALNIKSLYEQKNTYSTQIETNKNSFTTIDKSLTNLAQEGVYLRNEIGTIKKSINKLTNESEDKK